MSDDDLWAPPDEPRRRTAADDLDELPTPATVVVGPIEASAAPPRSLVARVAAAGVAAAMLIGGAFLVFGAATATGGADSPEAALAQALEAVERGDLIALAEVLDPAERATILDTGLALVDDLIRLEVLEPGVDLSSVSGASLVFAGFEPSVEYPRPDLAHLFVGRGVVTAAIDVAELPFGPLMRDRLDPEQRAWTFDDAVVIDPIGSPLVAVQRDGRWYLSGWYTVAENVRIESGLRLPDHGERPAAIGAPTPAAAAEQFVREASRLDLRRMIGMLDPEEAAALYDHAPLFLDDADRLANTALTSLEDEGWTWGFDELEFRGEPEIADRGGDDGDLATVRLVGLRLRAERPDGSAVLTVGDTVSAEIVTDDPFFDETRTWRLDLDRSCIVVSEQLGGEPIRTDRTCGDGLGLSDLGPSLLAGADGPTLVARRVDGRWFLAPVRTGLTAIVQVMESVDPEALLDLVDGAADLALNPVGDGDPSPVFPLGQAANTDLLAPSLEPAHVIDVDDASVLRGFIDDYGFAPTFERGLAATMLGDEGDPIALIVADLADGDAARDSLDEWGLANGGVLLTRQDRDGVPSVRAEAPDPLGHPFIIDITGDRLTLAGALGPDRGRAVAVFRAQLEG